jgi:hypothetical protein
MKSAIPIRFVLAAGVLLLATSCATQTMLETDWTLPGVQSQPLKKLAVIGTMKDQNESTAFESAAVALFAKDGVEAVPGFSFLKGETNLTQDEMEKRVGGTGAGGVLFFKVIAVDKSENYITPTPYVTTGALHPEWWEDPYWGYYQPYPYHYWGYWYPATQVVVAPGYWEDHKTYRIESTLYRVSDGKLIWTATSDTFDPADQVDLGKSVTKPVIENLKAHGLIRGK